ncbi:hypothetical protein ZEAMMB73_Zm00001d051426 [Zea mays]|uniref:Uncharacterized protein n=1 Tax=Zea mays TaxID=4577 RepID=A0A1D6Q6U0_MAIZE|nr:hypothetical protein ZEAMMB73_Zm00001d051426 [Zea mays]
MRRRPFLDQQRTSFKRWWQQRSWWARLLLSLLLALACVLLLAVLLGSPDPDTSPSTSARVLRMVAEYRQPLVKTEGASLSIAKVAAVATGGGEARVELDESARSQIWF